MSDLPKTPDDVKRIASTACRLYADALTLRAKHLTTTQEPHDINTIAPFINDTTHDIAIMLRNGELSSEDAVANFLARKLLDLTSTTARAELLRSLVNHPRRDRQAIVDRTCAEDHFAIESMAEAMGIGEETRTAINALTIAQEAKKSGGEISR
jgi:hypothetical protein